MGLLYNRLGRTGLTISRLVVGTVNLGGRVEESDFCRLLDHACAKGINVIDTANIYGWRVHKGYAEEVLGRWWARCPQRRDQIVLATKVGEPMGEDLNERGLSARHIISGCEASLRRLRTDRIDLYQMHHVDRGVGFDEVWEAMQQLVAQGKVRYVGSSNFAGWDIAMAQSVARDRAMLGLASEQCVYNLVSRYVELEVLPAAAALGLGVLAWSPLHGGLLSGVLSKLANGTAVKSAQGRAADALERYRSTLGAYEGFCRHIGRDPAEVGLAWVLARPGVSAAVVGPRTTAHLDGALRALEHPLSDGELARLDELFPPVGRGGPAPGAWLS